MSMLDRLTGISACQPASLQAGFGAAVKGSPPTPQQLSEGATLSAANASPWRGGVGHVSAKGPGPDRWAGGGGFYTVAR